MPRSTLTSKGQITVPKAVREALRLGEGDRVAFEIRGDGVVELRAESGDLMDSFGSLKPKAGKHVSLQVMERAIRAGGTRG